MSCMQGVLLSLLMTLLPGASDARLQAPAPAQADTSGEPPPPADSPGQARIEMRREVEEAVDAIGAYTAIQRDEAVRRSRLALDRMDSRIDALRAAWAAEAGHLGTEARTMREAEAERLRMRRDTARERLGAIQASGEAAWDTARRDFVRAYRELADALDGALQGRNGSQGPAPAGEQPAPVEEARPRQDPMEVDPDVPFRSSPQHER